MTYRDSSNQTGDLSESLVRTDLIRRGWQVYKSETRDGISDILVCLGHPKYVRIQVKTLSGNQLTKIVDRSGEVVSKNGKPRNSHDYAAEGIEWLAGVHKDNHKIYYYKHENYSKINKKSFSVKTHLCDDFPVNHVPSRHTKRGE